MVSLARGAASPLKMLFFTRRRANQLTMARKFTGREAASARNFWAAALLQFILGRVNNKRNKKGVRGDERPLAKMSRTLLMVVVVIVIRAFAVHSIHVTFHVFYHGIELGFLFVGQHFAHFRMDRVMHAHHFGMLIFF
jgi:hypothetical protein